jgi:hypothetical protein
MHGELPESHETFFDALAERLRPETSPVERTSPSWEPVLVEEGSTVTLGPASEIELQEDEVSFFVPFASPRPNERWLRLFRDARSEWPLQLREPQLEDDRGVWFGPLPVSELDQHVSSLKHSVTTTNRRYAQEVEPELRRQREEALRREDEARRLRAEVEARLRRLLG